MVFIKDNNLVMTNNGDHCLEEVEFPAASLTTYAGSCGNSGQSYDEAKLDLRLDQPAGLAFDGIELLFFGLQGKKRVICININTGQGNLLCNSASYVQYMFLDQYNLDVLATFEGGLGKIVRTDSTATLQPQYGGGSDVGTLSSLDLNEPKDLIQLDKDTWMIADSTLDR